MNSSFLTYFGRQNPKLRLPKSHQLNDYQTGLVTNWRGLSENHMPMMFGFIWRVHFMFWSPYSAIWYLAVWIQNIILIELNTEDTLYFFHQLMSSIMLNKMLPMVGLKKNTSQVSMHERDETSCNLIFINRDWSVVFLRWFLPIVKNIVWSMGENNLGTVFWVCIPTIKIN